MFRQWTGLLAGATLMGICLPAQAILSEKCPTELQVRLQTPLALQRLMPNSPRHIEADLVLEKTSMATCGYRERRFHRRSINLSARLQGPDTAPRFVLSIDYHHFDDLEKSTSMEVQAKVKDYAVDQVRLASNRVAQLFQLKWTCGKLETCRSSRSRLGPLHQLRLEHGLEDTRPDLLSVASQ
ncbi:MAG: hypothetical protein CL675_03065 [Bdellovibrionaceae bacterium]|nr:hypothetical protein [Pseudobdellovibrionaceae bacterium]